MVNDRTPHRDDVPARIGAAHTEAARSGTAHTGAAQAGAARTRAGEPGLTRRIIPLALLLVFYLHTAGCSEVVTTAPPVEMPFTMFGLFNPTADTQAVIVYPVVAGMLQPLGPEPLNVVVTSTDLESAEIRVWRDSVMTDDHSGYAHVFWSDFRAEFGRPYELEIVRSDGDRSAVTLNVPVDARIELQDEGTRWMMLHFGGEGFRLLRVQVTYGVQYKGDLRTPACSRSWPVYYYTFSYGGEEAKVEGGWQLPLDLRHYYHVLESFYDEDFPQEFSVFTGGFDGLALVSLTLDVTIADEAWNPPQELLDLTALSHPWTMTNVENGLGFVGAGYRRDVLLEPSPEAVRDSGFGTCEE